jgi:hypothetical protein
MKKIILLGVCLMALNVACASTPRWVNGIQSNDYFYQGVGQGDSDKSASRSALLGLCADISGVEVEETLEDFRREHGVVGQTLLEEDFKQWMKTYVKGELPPETKVVDRWSGRGQEWAYAVVEKPGKEKQIKRLIRDHMAGFVAHSFVPGWAQFQQRRNRAGWTYISGVGVGLLTGITGSILSGDRIERRDRQPNQVMKDYYDDQANKYYWMSMAGYTLAAVSYGINILDGQTVRVEPYEILTDRAALGFRLAVAF